MTPQEMQDLSKEFARQLKIVFGNNGPSNTNNNNNNNNRRSGSNSIRDSEGEAAYRKNFKRDLMGFSKSLRTIIDDADKVMRDFTISQQGIVNLQNKIYSDIVNNEKLSNVAQARLRKRLNEWAKQQSHLTSELMDAAGNYKDINRYLEETADKLEDYNDVLDENMSTTVRGITSLKKMAKAVDKLGKSAQYAAAMQAIMAKDAHGNYINSLSERKAQRKALIEQLAHSIDLETDARKKSREAILRQAADMGHTAGLMTELNSIGQKALTAGGFGFLLTKGTILLAAFVNALAQVGEYYKRILTSLSIGETGLAAPIKLSIQAAKIGISFEKLTALINENYRTVASLGGSKSFVDAIIQYRGALNSLGEFGEAANKGVAGMLEGARASGVDLKNRALLNTSMAAQQDAYKYLRTAINETAETFAKNNLTVLQSTEFEIRSALLSKKSRAQLITEIAMGRKQLAKSGILNSEIQMSILKQTQALLNKPVVDRFKDIGGVQKAGGFLQMGAEADEITKILLKGNSMSQDERTRLGTLITTMTKKNNAVKVAAQQRGDAGTENISDIISADLAKLLPDANKAIIEKENPNNQRNIEAEQAKRTVSENEQKLINTINTAAAVLGDRIVKALLALGVVITGLLTIKLLKGAGIGIMGFIVGLFTSIRSAILRGLALVFGAGAVGAAGGIVPFIVNGIKKLFGPIVIGIGVFRGLSEIWDDPRTNSNLAEKLSGGLSSMFAGVISTVISAITLGTVNLDVKKVKKVIEEKLFATIGDVILTVFHAVGSVFSALAQVIMGGLASMYNTIIDWIASRSLVPDSVSKKLREDFKINYGIDQGLIDATNTLFQTMRFASTMGKNINNNLNTPVTGDKKETASPKETDKKEIDKKETNKKETPPPKETSTTVITKTHGNVEDRRHIIPKHKQKEADNDNDKPSASASIETPVINIAAPEAKPIEPQVKKEFIAEAKPIETPAINIAATKPNLIENPVKVESIVKLESIKPMPTLLPKNSIMSTPQLQESVIDVPNNNVNKNDQIESQITTLNAILNVLKAQYMLEQQVAMSKSDNTGTVFGAIGLENEPAIS